MQETDNIAPILPAHARRAISLLEDAGFQAWAVGGFVRDALLGQRAHDVDIATNARWQQVAGLARAARLKTVETGTAHGTITLIVDEQGVEVTTFRTEEAYADARHPGKVAFVSSIEQDLARRDFTVNAMAYHPKRGLVDPYRGLQDLRAGQIRAVGVAAERFDEDALRILRAARFASELGFRIERDTAHAAAALASKLSLVSAERIAAELDRLLCGKAVFDVLMEQDAILDAALPELSAMRGFDQHSPYHVFDVMEHTAHVVAQVPPKPLLRWAALLHDIGKPRAFFTDEAGQGHFYGHPKYSAEIACGMLRRLHYPKRFTSQCVLLVRFHDKHIEAEKPAVKKMIRQLDGNPELLRELCALKRADGLAHAPQHQRGVDRANAIESVLDQILAEGEPFALKDMAVSGNDVLAAGVQPGPDVGKVLERTFDAVVSEQVPNEHDALLKLIRQLAAQPREE